MHHKTQRKKKKNSKEFEHRAFLQYLCKKLFLFAVIFTRSRTFTKIRYMSSVILKMSVRERGRERTS